MAWGFIGSEPVEISSVERDIRARIGSYEADVHASGVMTNIYRVASILRNHMEREVLGEYGLSFTAFIVLFTLWVWGDMEPQRLASKAGVTKGTLTGVVKTLERRGLCTRQGHPQDRRRAIVSLNDAGARVVEKVAPLYNREESRLVAGMDTETQIALAGSLRMIVATGVKLRSASLRGESAAEAGAQEG
ncbi:MAG: MarR family transcriptional regulator [Actinomycetota bacterium]|nr:MarR family transcriptional regulator [Actinomycetota bacterium]